MTRAVLVGDDRDDGDEAQLRVLAQGGAEVPADLLRPEVLVLEVDQPLGVRDGPGVGVGHAALPGRGEVVALGQDRGVGAQDLHGLGRVVGGRRGRRRLLAERPRGEVLAARQARQQPARVEGQRRGVLPPLAEGGLDVEHRRPLDRHVHVVPRRTPPERRRHRDDLVVALVVDVVAAAVAQVDAAEVGDVAGGVVAVPQHDELLVVRAAGAHPHVAQALAPRLVDLDAEQPRLLGVEAELVPVRAPQQPAHVGPAPGRGGERRRHRGCRVVGEPLVRVAAPVDEVEQVALPQRADPLVQLGHVGPAVDDGTHPVPLAPCDALRVVVVDDGVGVVALGRREEEIREHAAILPVRGPAARRVVGRCAVDRGPTLIRCRHAGDARGAR